MTDKSKERDLIIVDLLRKGETLAAAGRHFGITRERVRQIIKKLGFVVADLKPPKPEKIYTEEQKHRRFKKAADRFAKECGATIKPSMAFNQQKKNARKREIAFSLTFEQWWDLWRDHYKERGCGKGKLVMCRTFDKGPYEVGNVRIDSSTENGREYQAIRNHKDYVKSSCA